MGKTRKDMCLSEKGRYEKYIRLAKLAEKGLPVSKICEQMQIGNRTFYRRLKEDEDMRWAYERGRRIYKKNKEKPPIKKVAAQKKKVKIIETESKLRTADGYDLSSWAMKGK
ncbi:hypothetical protein TAMA11512_13020 [Selenomonas sp. TAMA-11512]|uniref:hypothetical protein n=1 Tax=Selenomonas sp. TAMA-11512 TaxID=3095337 RepID=UPI0030858FD1|nr:hypothetical protein TAMA11512_13020 [Selenomonas sp. TAMA-11512]